MHRVQFVLIVSLSALVRLVSSVKWRCLVPMLGSRGPAARPRHTCSLWDTNTNANGQKFSAGVYIIIVLTTITNVLSTGPIYKSRVCPHTFPECSVQCRHSQWRVIQSQQSIVATQLELLTSILSESRYYGFPFEYINIQIENNNNCVNKEPV